MTAVYKLSLALVVALAFLVAMPAFAASITNIEFDNGDVVYQGAGGSTVNAEFRIVVGPGEVVEQFETDVISDGLAPVCESVGGDKGLEEGTHFVTRQIKLPPNTGTYDVATKASGIFGALRAVDCASNVVDTTTFTDALRVVGGSSTGSGGAVFGGMTFADLVAALKAALGVQAPAPVTVPTQCTEIAKYTGAPHGTYSALGVQLQSALLLDNPYSIPALQPGSSTQMGYRGEQTNAALASFKAKHGCVN